MKSYIKYILLIGFVIGLPQDYLFSQQKSSGSSDALFDLLYSKSRNNINELETYLQNAANEVTNKNDDEKLNILILFKGRYFQLIDIKNAALENLLTAKTFFEKTNNEKYLAVTYLYIGSFFRHSKDLEKANEYYYKVNNLKNIDSSYYLWSLNHLGDVHFVKYELDKNKSHLDSALFYYELSNKNSTKPRDYSVIANNLNNIGDVYNKKGDFDLALFYFRQSIEITRLMNDISETMENYNDIAKCYLNLKDTKKALEYFYEANSKLSDSNLNYEKKSSYSIGMQIFKTLGNKDSIIKYSALLYDTEIKVNAENQARFTKMTLLDNEIEDFKYQNQILINSERNSTLLNYLLIATTIIVGLLLYVIWNKFINKKKENIELKQAYDKIKELNATKDKFFSIIGHDLKGPVGAMKSLLDLIVDDFEKFTVDDLNEIITDFKKQTDSTLSLLMNLLDWSRSQRGSISYEYQNINLNSLIDSNIMLLNNIATEKKIYLQNKLSSSFEIYADSNSISTVIRNLISNSIKYSKPNSTIDIGVESVDDQFATVFIRDYGVGMTEEQSSVLFSLSVNNSTYGTNNEKGTGLGLLICKDFVENNFGHIWVNSTQNVGSTFYFTVKIAKKN